MPAADVLSGAPEHQILSCIFLNIVLRYQILLEMKVCCWCRRKTPKRSKDRRNGSDGTRQLPKLEGRPQVSEIGNCQMSPNLADGHLVCRVDVAVQLSSYTAISFFYCGSGMEVYSLEGQ